MVVWIKLDVNTNEYNKLVKHIAENMFFGVKRIAPNLQHVIFHSIGDAMYNDLQDYESADIYLQQRMEDNEIDKTMLKSILSDKNWYIRVNHPIVRKQFLFVIEKDTDLIVFREEKEVSNEQEE